VLALYSDNFLDEVRIKPFLNTLLMHCQIDSTRSEGASAILSRTPVPLAGFADISENPQADVVHVRAQALIPAGN
jgi:hypothetical protein